MKTTKTRRRSIRKLALTSLAAGGVLALGVVLALDLINRDRGGPEHQVAVSEAPTAHPSAATAGGPQLHFSTTAVDLGLVPLNTEVGYAFSYANTGAKLLRIEDVSVRVLEGC
jgi:hypothetical protein